MRVCRVFYHGGSTAAVVSAQCKLTLTNSPPEQPLAAFLTPLTPPPPPCSSSGPLSIVSIQLSLFTSMPHQDIYISQYLPPSPPLAEVLVPLSSGGRKCQNAALIEANAGNLQKLQLARSHSLTSGGNYMLLKASGSQKLSARTFTSW